MKKEVPLHQAKWLIEPGCVVLVTGGTMAKANVMTFSWQTPVHTADPCRVLLVINQVRYTYEFIRQNGELVINVPGANLLEATHRVGRLSGRGIDKFADSGLTPVPARVVGPPLIEQCAGHLIRDRHARPADLRRGARLGRAGPFRRRLDSGKVPHAALS